MSCRSTCGISGHALLKRMIYSRISLTGRQVHMRTGSIGWHIMQEDMYYWKASGSGGHVFHENMSYGSTYLVGGCVLQVCAGAATI